VGTHGLPGECALTTLDSQQLAAFIDRHGLAAQLVRLATETPTVEAAAQALGVDTDEIIKSLVFVAAGTPVVVVASGTRPVPSQRLAAHLGLEPSEVSLASPDRVQEATGYPVGAVPPFGHKTPLTTLIDSTALQHEWVYGGGGEIRVLLKVRPDTIRTVTGAEVVELQAPSVDRDA
jgi:Cys-tRNA(Pro) deacylase